MQVLKEGEPAPEFCLPDESEMTVCLKDFRGRWLVIYFYPKDNTSGCTQEAKDFSERIDDFRKQGAEVIGISPDSPQSHRRFIQKQGLTVKLLSDQEHNVLEAYGVWQLKRMYGREYYGVVRSTFLVDPEGIVRRVWRRVKVKGHVEEVLNALKGLTSPS